VYNRVASGEGVFSNPDEATDFVDRIRAVKHRDDWTVFAYCVMPNHFHLAVRTATVGLATSLHSLQGKFSRAFNRRWSRSGGLWQSRYHAKLIDEQRYLSQVILYVHLNPVRAGIVEDPAEYVFSGHREIVRSSRETLVDVDDALLCFDETRRAARQAYVAGIRAGIGGEEANGEGSMTWWESIPWREDELEPRDDNLAGGCLKGLERKPTAAELVEASCDILAVTPQHLKSGARDRTTAALRRLMMTVLAERWGQGRGDLAAVLDRNPEVVSHWITEGRSRRSGSPEFARQFDELDAELNAWCEQGDDD